MAQQDLLLLQILKVPVWIIKSLARILSIATYLPNYLVLLIVDYFLFSPQFQSSLLVYSLMWIPKMGLLFFSLSVFCLQFYAIFHLLLLEEHSLTIQIVGMVMTFAGLVILMRKGYLSLIGKYNLQKLKSVRQHFELAYYLFVDLVGVILALLNVLMLVNITKTLNYTYLPNDYDYRYIRHIFITLKETVIFYIEFFYLKVFFKLFPWRFAHQKDTYLKEKQQKNVLNCLVLLTLTFLSTLVDLFVYLLVGLPNVIHFKRQLFFKRLSQTHQKWKPTLKHFLFIFLHSLQLIIQAAVFPICWKQSAECLKKLMAYQQTKDLFGQQFVSLMLKVAVRIPYFFCNFIIFIFHYKYLRRQLLVKKFQAKKNTMSQEKYFAKKQLIKQKNTFKCFGQLCLDLPVFVLVPLALLLKPWQFRWFPAVMKKDYQVDRTFLAVYTARCLLELLLIPFAILGNLPFLLYQPKQPLRNYQQAISRVNQDHEQLTKKEASLSSEPNKSGPYINRKSPILQFTIIGFSLLFKDLPSLPVFFICKATLLSLYDSQLKPQKVGSFFFRLYKQYYRLKVSSCSKGKYYQDMFNRMQASGNLTQDEPQQAFFWRKSYRCQKMILVQTILKIFLRRRSIQRIKERVQKGNNLSQLSNEYWYQYQLTKAYLLRLIFYIIEIIISIIGFAFLLPLTLWRLPTFVKLYAHHRNRRFFFNILFKMYRQMLEDILILPLKLLSLVFAPKMMLSFIVNTSFKYGPSGVETFRLYQKKKREYFLQHIFAFSLVSLLVHCEIMFIYVTWIRLKSLRACLRRNKLTTYTLYRRFILSSPKVPAIESMLNSDKDLNSWQKSIDQTFTQIRPIFFQALADLPYLFIIAILFMTMPWRFNYIIQAIRDTRDDTGQRKAFLKLFQNIFKDYACILLNIVLLLSVFKTRKALILIRRNYRLNFFIGFLEYSYFNQLLKELYNLGLIYIDCVYFLVACLFGWTRAPSLVRQLIEHRRKVKEEEQEAAKNLKMYQNTVKSGKELQLLNKMGFYNYLTVCSFLETKDIISLRRVDKLNYQMSKRQQVWFTKWQTVFSKKHNFIDQQFQSRCKKAFLVQKAGPAQHKVESYHTIVMKHFYQNVREQDIDLAAFAREQLPERIYNRIFRYYRYEHRQGYGPQNQLPQAEDQDQQFLRLTNQRRRPRVELTENEAFANWLCFKPVQVIVQVLTRFFRVDQHRRKKQLLSILLILLGILTILFCAFKTAVHILWLQPQLGLKIMLMGYLIILAHTFMLRLERVLPTWVSLQPFDIFQDLVKLCVFIRDQIKNKVVNPITNLIRKIINFIKKVLNYVWAKICAACNKTVDFTVEYSKIAYERYLKPLYVVIADRIIKIKNFLVTCFTAIFEFLSTVVKGLFDFIVLVFKSVYRGLYSLFANMNKLYYFILQSLMTFLLRFGLLGNLVFTLLGLLIMTMPTIIWWWFYSKRWYLIVSSIHTMVLIVVGYKHLNKIKGLRQ